MAEEYKLNLLFIPYTFTNGGGAEKILQILVNNLSPDKYNIAVQEVEQFNKFLDINDNVTIHQAFFNQKLPFSSFNNLNFILLKYIPSILKNVYLLNKYDLIITYNYQLPSFMLPAFKYNKTLAWFHGDLYDLQDKSKKWEKDKQYKVWSYADKIITISNKSYNSLKDLFPEYISKAKIIHNGIDIAKIHEAANEEIFLNNINEPLIVCIGRLDQNKNFLLAINALSELIKQNIKCKLLIVGEGEQKELLENEARNLGISEYVIFAGFQTNPYKYISKSKVLCVTSLSEGWPTVVMEAMSLGIPFVTTPVSGASEELSDNGKCGLVSGYNPQEFAQKLKSLLTDEKLYSIMSKNCIEHEKDYSVEKYVLNFENLLSEIKAKKIEIRKNIFAFIISYFIYFILYILSIGEIIYRIQIIGKRIKEKRIIKFFKNIIFLTGIIFLLPVTLIFKCLFFPFFIRKIKIKDNK